MKTIRCPVCRDHTSIRVVKRSELDLWPHPDNQIVSHCSACGYCIHRHKYDGNRCPDCGRPAVDPRQWRDAAHLPRPATMGDDEFAFRAGLFVKWFTLSATEFVSHLCYFADWLADRGHPEEMVARANWEVYGQLSNNPRGWWQWSVPIADGWVSLDRYPTPERIVNGRDYVDIIESKKCKLSSSTHNGGWFLCWPPGWVRFTAPLYHDWKRMRVTVQKRRSCSMSAPYESKFTAGYAALFHPPGAMPTRKEMVKVGSPSTPSLFDIEDA